MPSTSRKILIADDIALNRLVLRSHLESMGHEVREACDGADALRCLSSENFDLAIIDCKMPLMTGIEVIGNYRRTGQAATPIYLITTDPTSEIKKSAADAGAQGLIERPITPEKLEQIFD
jgi:two-component system sensor histidine kinase EvgS